MTSKQKIMVSVIGIVMVLAIIGLTVGLVLTATQVTASTSMNVSFTSREVDATIVGSAKYYAKGTGEGTNIEVTNGTATFTAGTETNSHSMTFAAQEYANPTDYVIYSFVVTNTAPTADAAAIDAYYKIVGGTNATIQISTDGATYTEANTTANTLFSASDGIAAQNGQLTLYVKVTVKDKTLDMSATGVMSITLVQHGQSVTQ